MLLGLDFSVQYVNKTLTGATTASIAGRSVFEFISETQAEELRHWIKIVRETKEPAFWESTSTGPGPSQGTIHWETRVGPNMDGNEVIGFIFFANDVTAKKKAQIERESLFNLSGDLMCVLNFEGNFLSFNPAFCTALGYSEEYLLSHPFMELIHPEDRQKSTDAFAQLVDHDNMVGEFENRYITADGSYKVIEWSGALDLEAQLIAGVGRDVTEKRELEQQLLQSQKMEAVGHLAGGVAHDFNNLLMAILANAELATLTDDLNAIKKRLGDIESATIRAAELSNKLLTFSRKQPTNKINLDLNQLIESFLKLLTRLIPKSIQISFEPDTSLGKISADRAQIEQVLMNLCVNARDAIIANGNIIIRTRAIPAVDSDTPAQALLIVQDDGGGISKEFMDRIFDPFFTTKQEGSGSGLGLSTAYGIVQQHGGNIEVTNTSEAGTTISVYLPANPEAVDDQSIRIQDEILGGTETILIAEDEAAVSEAAISTLKNAGYQVVSARNGQEAIDLCSQRQDIDLVFMDVIMPEVGGPEAAHKIREIKPELPILFASGFTKESDGATAIPDDIIVISKPYRREVLLRNIRDVIDS